MSALTLDTLAFSKSLKAAGVQPDQADAIAEGVNAGIRESLLPQLATKADLKDVRAEIKDVRVEMEKMRTELKTEIAEVRSEVREMGASLKTEIVKSQNRIFGFIGVGLGILFAATRALDTQPAPVLAPPPSAPPAAVEQPSP